nr:sugar ABC transporter permease [Marinicella sp. W31]MDC2878715.1 sugar ABC transporter permease [Marinicella sp. W31]
MEQIFKALLAVAVGVFVAVAYFYGSNKILDLIFPSQTKDPADGARNLRTSGMIRPWLFLGPALLTLGVYLVYPVVASVWYSLHGPYGDTFVGLSNYQWMLGDSEFRQSIFNNMLWLVFVPALSTFFGLIIAWLTDRIWWGSFAKMMIFMPMAISFVGASVIWKFVYDYRGEGSEQIGILNAIVVSMGGEPHVWIAMPFWNNFFLMVILLWIQTGFAMVLLSAALRGIPEETIEAAVIDGANGGRSSSRS